MELDAALDFARTTRQSVLVTIRANGHPQLSNVMHHVFDDGIIRVVDHRRPGQVPQPAP